MSNSCCRIRALSTKNSYRFHRTPSRSSIRIDSLFIVTPPPPPRNIHETIQNIKLLMELLNMSTLVQCNVSCIKTKNEIANKLNKKCLLCSVGADIYMKGNQNRTNLLRNVKRIQIFVFIIFCPWLFHKFTLKCLNLFGFVWG